MHTPAARDFHAMIIRYFVVLCIALGASGLLRADERASHAAGQRVVASIKVDLASDIDCVSDDDLHRFHTLPGPSLAHQAPGPEAASTARPSRKRLARIERETRSAPVLR
jgi:hypothetical protein